MSEFSQSWSPNLSLPDNMRYAEAGWAYLQSQMQMPEDDRLIIPYGLEIIGGQDAAVLAIGNAGSGKTRFGNLVLGSEVRVDMENTDTEDTLFGYANPINKDERIPGKFSGKLTAEEPVVSANEISHVPNTGPLHRLWDDDFLLVNGEMIPMHNASIYATSNFPNGQRVHELDPAMRSRFAVEVLFGDADSEFAQQLHGRDIRQPGTVAEVNATGSSIPNAQARQNLRGQVIEAYPVDGRDFGGYVSSTIDAINERRDLFPSLSNTDKRLSNGWIQAVRARLLMEGATSGRVDARQAAKVAALVLPSSVVLNQQAKAELKKTLGVAKIDPLTEAVARRRLLSSLAYRVLEQKQAFPEDDKQAYRDRFRDEFSYASANGQSDAIDEFVEKALEVPNNEPVTPEATGRRKQRSLRRR